MLSFWNSHEIPSWAIARQQRLANAQRKTRERFTLTKTFMLGVLMASAYLIALELVLR